MGDENGEEKDFPLATGDKVHNNNIIRLVESCRQGKIFQEGIINENGKGTNSRHN